CLFGLSKFTHSKFADINANALFLK
ncbi:uncharacterized protein METZ01_LOCUS125260, partial [marine metagenome]